MSGLTLFLIERSPGVDTRPIGCQGNIGSGTAFVTLSNVRAKSSAIIGGLNKGFKCIMNNFNSERLGICIGSIRSARVCFEDALKYSLMRKTFGKLLFDRMYI